MNERGLLVLLMLVWGAGASDAQELAFSGYYENRLFVQELNARMVLQDYDKLRLDLSADVGEHVSFRGDYVYTVYHGAKQFHLADVVPEEFDTLTAAIPPGRSPMKTFWTTPA